MIAHAWTEPSRGALIDGTLNSGECGMPDCGKRRDDPIHDRNKAFRQWLAADAACNCSNPYCQV